MDSIGQRRSARLQQEGIEAGIAGAGRGGAMGTCTAGGTGGVGRGALAAQATRQQGAAQGGQALEGVKGRVIPNSYTRLPGRGVSFG
ncbi:MAG: hypothetical protein NVV73_12330 [Cellvibrionaceae bacterium]|nr:hypothetical protein [Cellvibrionaceae bacterium]